MLKEKIVVADVVKKYENPIGELVQVACQFSSNINPSAKDAGSTQRALWGLWRSVRGREWKLTLKPMDRMKTKQLRLCQTF